MARKFTYHAIQRSEGNPLITIDDIPFACNMVFNAGCAKYKGEYILLLRVEGLTGRSVSTLAQNKDGYHKMKIYYGASDTSICVDRANVNELMRFCTIGEH